MSSFMLMSMMDLAARSFSNSPCLGASISFYVIVREMTEEVQEPSGASADGEAQCMKLATK
jgi:hypothetical protein